MFQAFHWPGVPEGDPAWGPDGGDGPAGAAREPLRRRGKGGGAPVGSVIAGSWLAGTGAPERRDPGARWERMDPVTWLLSEGL